MTRWEEYKVLARRYETAMPGSQLFKATCNEMDHLELHWARFTPQVLLNRALRDEPEPS